MTKLILYSALFGMVGGVLKSMCIALAWIFYPQGRDIYSSTVGLYLSQTLFIVSICMVKGVAEHSISLLRRGSLIGLFSGILATSAVIALLYFKGREYEANWIWFDHSLINGLFLGGAAGTIYGTSSNDRNAVYCIVGLLVGGVASFSIYISTTMASMSAFLLWKFSFLLDISMLYEKLAVYIFEGIILSLLIWSALALAEKVSARRSVSLKISPNGGG